MSAEDRRAAVLRSAAGAFAERGYEGTSTEDVAERAGISQPYIFRLFGSKKELFLAVLRECFERTCTMFQVAADQAEGQGPQEVLEAMGHAYAELISDPVNLQVQMHAFAASVNDADVRAITREGMRRIWQMAARASAAPADQLRQWVATGMLCNMIVALDLENVDETWARELVPMDKACDLQAEPPHPGL